MLVTSAWNFSFFLQTCNSCCHREEEYSYNVKGDTWRSIVASLLLPTFNVGVFVSVEIKFQSFKNSYEKHTIKVNVNMIRSLLEICLKTTMTTCPILEQRGIASRKGK